MNWESGVSTFLPHAGKSKAQKVKPIASRKTDVIYAGGLSRDFAYGMMPNFGNFSFDARQIAEDALADIIAHPSKTTEQAIEEQLLAAGIRLTASNLHYEGRISADEVIDRMMDAKIVLNTMTWFKDGTHDRVFNGMLAGAVIVSDSSVYMAEEFCGDITSDKAELMLFELDELEWLPDIIKELLADPKWMQQIADRGRQKALYHHTWKTRAMELHEDLLSQLS